MTLEIEKDGVKIRYDVTNPGNGNDLATNSGKLKFMGNCGISLIFNFFFVGSFWFFIDMVNISKFEPLEIVAIEFCAWIPAISVAFWCVVWRCREENTFLFAPEIEDKLNCIIYQDREWK